MPLTAMPRIICCRVLLHLAVKHVSGLSAATVQGWITAFGTAVLAVFAIVAAWCARQALLKQSKEVRDMADMLDVQSNRLVDQRRINELHAKDLEEPLRERERLRRITEREQADAVGFTWWPASHVLRTRSCRRGALPGNLPVNAACLSGRRLGDRRR